MHENTLNEVTTEGISLLDFSFISREEKNSAEEWNQ